MEDGLCQVSWLSRDGVKGHPSVSGLEGASQLILSTPERPGDSLMVTEQVLNRGRKRIWEYGGIERARNCETQRPHLHNEEINNCLGRLTGEVKGVPTTSSQEQVLHK